MFIKFVAVLIILVGIAGVVLPIIPGVLLITIGVLLLFKDKTAEIRKTLPEKIPAVGAIVYNWFIPKMLSPYYNRIFDEIPSLENKKVLDLGTGSGILTIGIAAKFPSSKVIGIDISEKMVEIAAKNRSLRIQNAPAGTGLDNLEFKVMDAKALDFSEGSFDFIISTGSMHHWKEPLKVFNEMYRCLRSGGEAWIYDGYGDVSKEDVAGGTKRMLGIFPPYCLIKFTMRIHGYTENEYGAFVRDVVSKVVPKGAVLEHRGLMMRLRLQK